MPHSIKYLLVILFFHQFLFADFILTDENYQPLDMKKLNSTALGEVRSIYQTILLKYQWPMMTMYFDEMDQKEKGDLLSSLNEEGGISRYINEKIAEKYKGKYKAIFVPNSYVELAAMIVFAHQTFERQAPNAQDKNKPRPSAFPDDDLRNSTFANGPFPKQLKESIFSALGQKEIGLGYLKKAFEESNLRNEVYELYIETAFYLVKNFGASYLVDSDNIAAVVSNLVSNFLKIEGQFFQESAQKNYFIALVIKRANTKWLKDTDVDHLVHASSIEWQAFLKNEFVLFRAIQPLDLNIDNASINIIETPYRELSKTEKHFFAPSTNSLANSLLAGTFYEAQISGGARTLDYLRDTKFGYALVFSIKDFLLDKKNKNNLSLRDKYFIAPLCSISALFSSGELFHSRSKISSNANGKSLSRIHGTYPQSINHILLRDLEERVNFIFESDIEWSILAADLTADIGKNSFNLDRNRNQDFQTRKKNQATVVDRILSIKPTMSTVNKNWPTTRSNLQFDYRENTFSKIINNPNEAQTKIYFNDKYFMAFDDLRKRTKAHALVIPKGAFTSFSHLAKVGNDDEIASVFQGIAKTAKAMKLDKTGYRFITNVRGQKGNDANQEVMHLHFHVAGDECLGMPVVAENEHAQLNDDVLKLPSGFALLGKKYIENILPNALFSFDSKKYKFIAHRIYRATQDIPIEVGFVIVNDNNEPAFTSIEDFAENVDKGELAMFVKFISDVANNLGLNETGYRIFSMQGRDAWQLPKNIFQIFIAGGMRLGPTVSNFYGNQSANFRNVDYDGLGNKPHWHCPSSIAQFHYFNENYQLLESHNLDEQFDQARTDYDSVKKTLNSVSKGMKKYLIKADKKSLSFNYMSNVEGKTKNYLSKLDDLSLFGFNQQDWLNFFEQGNSFENQLLKQAKTLQEIKPFTEILTKDESPIYKINAIRPTIKQPKDEWIFLDLDQTLTAGIDSSTVNEKDLVLRLKEFQADAGKVIALTGRYYWDGMEDDVKNQSMGGGAINRDTFKLLKEVGFEFSNPGNLPEFFLGYPGANKENVRETEKFKDGVIFCSEKNKGTCLIMYLQKLLENKIELPTVINFYDDNYQKIEEVRDALKQHEIFGRLYHYAGQ